MIVIAEDSVRFAHSGPSHNLLRPAIAELGSCGPLPLHMSAGGHASAIPTILPVQRYKNTKRMYEGTFRRKWWKNTLTPKVLDSTRVLVAERRKEIG